MHSDMGIIGACLGCGQQNEGGVMPGRFMGTADKLLADSATLIISVDRQVGEVGAKAAIGNRPRDADQ